MTYDHSRTPDNHTNSRDVTYLRLHHVVTLHPDMTQEALHVNGLLLHNLFHHALYDDKSAGPAHSRTGYMENKTRENSQ